MCLLLISPYSQQSNWSLENYKADLKKKKKGVLIFQEKESGMHLNPLKIDAMTG